MRCPRCTDKELEQQAPRKDVLIDLCRGCRGVWLDKNEIYFFVKRPQQVYQEFLKAYRTAAPSKLICPRCALSMREAMIEGTRLRFEACGKCGGNWFDAGEVQQLNLCLDQAPPSAAAPPAAAPAAAAPHAAAPHAAAPPPDKRPLSAEEILRFGHANAPLLESLFLSVPVALTLAAGCRFILGIDTANLPALLAAAYFISGLVFFLVFSRKNRYLRGAWAVPGTVEGHDRRHGTMIDVRVGFAFNGERFTVNQRVDVNGPMDPGPGRRVWLAVNPSAPRNAFVIPIDDGRRVSF